MCGYFAAFPFWHALPKTLPNQAGEVPGLEGAGAVLAIIPSQRCPRYEARILFAALET